ncbi:MAG: insulinase family protein [Candidatus Desulforudis sp.]|nr:insulinase family protein [Desulforudis sp.]
MVKKIVLDNGVRILTEEIRHVRSAAFGVWVDVGSRDEEDGAGGVCHFIEHMLFKGTQTRSARDIAEAFDRVGGQLNAYTTKEYTCYYARVLDEHLDLAIDIISDMLFRSRFAPEDLERERNVIVEEIKMYEDTPDELVHDVLAQVLWREHALGRPVIGDAAVIRALSRDDLLEYHQRHYGQGRMVIAVAGNVEHDRVVERLEGIFGDTRVLGPSKPLIAPTPYPGVFCREKDTEQVHLCIGTQGLHLDDENIYVAQVINTLLGGGLSSRLFQRVREQMGLVYNIYSYHSSYRDTGLFGIYAGLSPENVGTVLEIVLDELNDVRNGGVTEAELALSKEQLKGNFLLSLESVSARMSRLGRSELYLGRVHTPDEIVRKLARVESDQAAAICDRILSAGKLSLATIGPWRNEGVWEEALGGGL